MLEWTAERVGLADGFGRLTMIFAAAGRGPRLELHRAEQAGARPLLIDGEGRRAADPVAGWSVAGQVLVIELRAEAVDALGAAGYRIKVSDPDQLEIVTRALPALLGERDATG